MPGGGSDQRLDVEIGFTERQAIECLAQAGERLASADPHESRSARRDRTTPLIRAR